MHSPASTSSALMPDHVLVLYASETGNAQDVAERVAREFRRHGRRAITLSMERYDVGDLPHEPLLVLITSTHGRGDPPPAMRPLWEKLIRRGLPGDILEDVHYALFGLGDSSYERFCFAGKMLVRRLESLGAQQLSEPAWGDERAPDGIEQTFVPWLEQTVDIILPYLPAPSDSYIPIPNTSLSPPIYSLTPVDTLPSMERLSLANDHECDNNHENGLTCHNFSQHEGHRWKPDGWAWAKLSENKRVTKDGWWQDVRDIELSLEDDRDFSYPPGSICSLHPRSSDEEVDAFLEMMSLEHEADKTVIVSSSLPEQPLPPHLPHEPTSLRMLLTHHLDLRCPPRKSFFEWLRRLSTDEREQERLDEFIADPDEIFTYASRPKRTILEALADFRFTRLPLSHLLEILPPLRRRQFSIASSSGAHLGKVQLLVALVEYKTNLKIPRRGLCSSWLDKLPIDTRIPLQILPPTLVLPQDPEVPVVLVGPGTGVAPMRAFLEERVRQGAAANTVLYFGCRSRESDYYYHHEWDKYRQMGARIEIAPSRDQEDKVYVQHLIRRDAKLIKEWVQDRHGWVFISGSSNAMPREVRAAIAWCLSSDGAGDKSIEDAVAYVDELFDAGRGGEESW